MPVETIYRCGICRCEVTDQEEMTHCENSHKHFLAKEIPKYSIGGRVTTRKFGDYNNPSEKTKIVKMIGEGVKLKLLVEDSDEERYWVNAVDYDSGYKNPVFRFIPIAV